MSKRKPVKKVLQLSDRTLQDLISIEEYSITTWGKRVATRYMSDVEAALQRISDNPGLLREEPNLHEKGASHISPCAVEGELISQVMDACKSKTKAAERLGINRNTLHKKLQEYGLE